MKNLIYLFVLSLFLFNCSTDDDHGYNYYGGTMEAEINGELVIFDRISPNGPVDWNNRCVSYINSVKADKVNKQDSIGHSITINVPIFRGEGTYSANALYQRTDLTSSAYYNDAFYYQNHDFWDIQELGEVTITSLSNKRCEGTFYFTAKTKPSIAERLGFSETMFVTNGIFNFSTDTKNLNFCEND